MGDLEHLRTTIHQLSQILEQEEAESSGESQPSTPRQRRRQSSTWDTTRTPQTSDGTRPTLDKRLSSSKFKLASFASFETLLLLQDPFALEKEDILDGAINSPDSSIAENTKVMRTQFNVAKAAGSFKRNVVKSKLEKSKNSFRKSLAEEIKPIKQKAQKKKEKVDMLKVLNYYNYEQPHVGYPKRIAAKYTRQAEAAEKERQAARDRAVREKTLRMERELSKAREKQRDRPGSATTSSTATDAEQETHLLQDVGRQELEEQLARCRNFLKEMREYPLYRELYSRYLQEKKARKTTDPEEQGAATLSVGKGDCPNLDIQDLIVRAATAEGRSEHGIWSRSGKPYKPHGGKLEAVTNRPKKWVRKLPEEEIDEEERLKRETAATKKNVRALSVAVKKMDNPDDKILRELHHEIMNETQEAVNLQRSRFPRRKIVSSEKRRKHVMSAGGSLFEAYLPSIKAMETKKELMSKAKPVVSDEETSEDEQDLYRSFFLTQRSPNGSDDESTSASHTLAQSASISRRMQPKLRIDTMTAGDSFSLGTPGTFSHRTPNSVALNTPRSFGLNSPAVNRGMHTPASQFSMWQPGTPQSIMSSSSRRRQSISQVSSRVKAKMSKHRDSSSNFLLDMYKTKKVPTDTLPGEGIAETARPHWKSYHSRMAPQHRRLTVEEAEALGQKFHQKFKQTRDKLQRRLEDTIEMKENVRNEMLSSKEKFRFLGSASSVVKERAEFGVPSRGRVRHIQTVWDEAKALT